MKPQNQVNKSLWVYALSLSLYLLLSVKLFAQEAKTIDIPIMENAQVFAYFNDDLPAVVNYFIRTDEASIINFYQEQYGEALSSERKRKRLTLHFSSNGHKIRVVISSQNNKQQVDVIVELDNDGNNLV